MQSVGVIRQLARYPVKSMQGEALLSAALTLQGFDEDRRYAFVQAASHSSFPWLTARELPVLLDLGPVVGSNVSFFGEQLGCKIFVEDIFADLDRHVREGKLDQLPEFLRKRFPQADGEVDGILCWDLIDYLDRPAAQQLEGIAG